MNALKEKRNEYIRVKFRELRDSGRDKYDAVELLYNSPENKYWCISWETIYHIATHKKTSKKV